MVKCFKIPLTISPSRAKKNKYIYCLTNCKYAPSIAHVQSAISESMDLPIVA